MKKVQFKEPIDQQDFYEAYEPAILSIFIATLTTLNKNIVYPGY